MRIADDFNLPRFERDPFGSFQSVYSTNSTNFEEDDLALTRRIAYQIIGPIIVSFGLMGNILTLLILRNPMFKGVMFNFFYALAFFDLLSLLFSISALIHLLHPVTKSYAIAFWYSYLEVMFVNGLMGTSVLIVVCITFDRYMSACYPFTFKTLHTDKYCKLGIVFSFIVAFLVWLPTSFLKTPEQVSECENFYLRNEYENSTAWVACLIIDPHLQEWYNIYAWIREIIISFLPLAIVIVLNCLLVKYFVEKHKHYFYDSQNHSTNINTPKQEREVGDKNLRSLLKAIIIAFLVTILPAGIFNAAFSEKVTTNLKYEIFRATANNLELLNHALNFYLYILLSKPIRSALPALINDIKSEMKAKLNLQERLKNIKSTTIKQEATEVRARETRDQLSIKRDQIKSLSRQTQLSDISIESPTKDSEMPKVPETHEVPEIPEFNVSLSKSKDTISESGYGSISSEIKNQNKNQNKNFK